MPYLVWNKEISVGIDSIDREHQNLIALLNLFHDAVHHNRNADALSAIFDELATYIVTHFMHEEEHMMRTHYPGLFEHKYEHDTLRRELMAFHEKAMGTITPRLGKEILIFLKCWFSVHAISCDRAFAPYLRAKGVT